MSKANLRAVPATPQITYAIETITPAIAAGLLRQNKNNRNLRVGVVKNYANEMLAGQWAVNGEDIIVDDEGNLLNGQHRLSAVIRADMGVRMGVKRGVDASSFKTMDAGITRTASDTLGIAGRANSAVMAAAARLILLYNQNFDLNSGIPKTEVSRFAMDEDYLEELTKQCTKVRKGAGLNAAPVAAVLYLANRGRDCDADVAMFLDSLATGANMAQFNPIMTLRQWARPTPTSKRVDKTGTAFTARFTFAAVARAWSGFKSREKSLKFIVMPQGFNRSYINILGYEEF